MRISDWSSDVCSSDLVSDTSEVDPWTSAAPHPRLKVVRPGTGISVVDNFNTALSHATGDYVCFIGDDDLIAPEIVDIACKAKSLSVDAVRFTFRSEAHV